MPTISLRESSLVKQRLERLLIPNDGIVKRPGADSIMRKVLPAVRRAFRTSKLPSGLDLIESKEIVKVMWPRSRYDPKQIIEMANLFRLVEDGPPPKTLLKDSFSHPWKASITFDLQLELERNKRALEKSGALPRFEKKKDALQAALQYNAEVVKPSPRLENCYSSFPGVRTQQAETSKSRMINMIPTQMWLLESEAYDSGISITIEENRGESKDVKLFYCRPEEFHNWWKSRVSNSSCWISTDWSYFDTAVRGNELEAGIEYFCSNYEYASLLRLYARKAAIVMPRSDIQRDGGMLSGRKSTNLEDGFHNGEDTAESLERVGLFKFAESFGINGDDQVVGFSTKITTRNLEQIGKYSRRDLNPGKCQIAPDWIWFSKWYMDENIMTRPVFRVLNSLMFKEREINLMDEGFKVYVAISRAQIISDCEQHPLSDVLISEMAKIEKYPLTTFEDGELIEAAELYLQQHNWRAEWTASPRDLVDTLKSTKYVQATS